MVMLYVYATVVVKYN